MFEDYLSWFDTDLCLRYKKVKYYLLYVVFRLIMAPHDINDLKF